MVFIEALRKNSQTFCKTILLVAVLSFSACTLQWNDNKPSTRQTQPSSTSTTTTRTPTKNPTTTTSGTRPAHHVVQSGEGFYSIAKRYGLDYRQVAEWNNMSTKDVIFTGMKIKLYPPKGSATTASTSSSGSSNSSSSVSPSIKLQWPLRGRIVNKFNDQDRTIKGIDIAGHEGQRIQAAASGKVVYAGSGLVGLGNVIVIKHNDTYLTAYGYNDKLLMSEGESVSQGQDIAIIGVGLNNQRMLHFEVRKNGDPVDPMGYLRN